MKRDIRKQTFSKPVKPDDDEIKRLTGEENETSSPVPKINSEAKAIKKGATVAPKQNLASKRMQESKVDDERKSEKVNPFLLSRGQSTEIGIEKTGYRLRSDYMDLLKLVKRMKKGYTLEAVLDDVLTYYFENSEDGSKAIKQRAILDAEIE